MNDFYPISDEAVPQPFRDHFYVLTHPETFKFVMTSSDFSGWLECEESELNDYRLNQAMRFFHRVLILHWVIKLKYDSKHEIPRELEDRRKNTIKPLGELYVAVLNLCLELHPFVSDTYKDAAEWFKWILLENAVESAQINAGADERTRVTQSENKQLRGYENPFNQGQSPHTFRLFEVARHCAERNDLFRKSSWPPFVQSREKWIQHRRKTKGFLTQVWTEDGLKIYRSGRGRSEWSKTI